MVEDVLKKYGERIVAQLKDDIRNKPLPRRKGQSYTANASGALADSVRFEVDEQGLKVFANDYIYYLMFGRKPGKWPPREPILQWIKDKGIQSNIPINSLAFLIQRSIGQNGTLLFPAGSDLVSSLLSDDLINSLASDLFSEFVDAIVADSNTLQKAA